MEQTGFTLPTPALKPLRSMNRLDRSIFSRLETLSLSEQERLPFVASRHSLNAPSLALSPQYIAEHYSMYQRREQHNLMQAFFYSEPISFRDTNVVGNEFDQTSSRDEADQHRLKELDLVFAASQRAAEIEERFPFLRYASRYWHCHAFWSLDGHPLPLSSADFEPCTQFLALLSTFLLDMKRVTTWVEGSCIFGFMPLTSLLADPMSRLGSHNLPPGVARRDFLWTLRGMKQLSFALQGLHKKHFRTLWITPAAIWGPEISAATIPDFWPMWEPPDEDEGDDGEDDTAVKVGDGGISSYVASH